MNLFCPTCEAAFSTATLCPRCGGRLITPGEAFAMAADSSPDATDPIPPTAAVRVIVGTVAALGLFFALREWVSAGLSAFDLSETWWRGPNAKYANTGLAAFATILGGLLAGAGRPIGAVTGIVVGIACAVLVVTASTKPGRPPAYETQLGAALIVGLGAIAGLVGSRIWPTKIELPSADAGSRGSSISSLGRSIPGVDNDTGQPTAWIKIILATALAVATVVFAEVIREWLRTGTGGRFNVGGDTWAPFVSLQIAGFLMMIVAAIAGVGTGAGLRHGLICGALTAAGVVFLATRDGLPLSVQGLLELYDLPFNLRVPQTLIALVGTLIGACAVAGWFGGLLLPPLAPKTKMKRVSSLT